MEGDTECIFTPVTSHSRKKYSCPVSILEEWLPSRPIPFPTIHNPHVMLVSGGYNEPPEQTGEHKQGNSMTSIMFKMKKNSV